MTDPTIPPTGTPLTTEEKAAAFGAAASSIASIAGTVSSLAAPQFLPLVAAFAAVLKFAPGIYIDFVSLFASGTPITAEQKSDMGAKLSEMMNPSAAYADPPAVAPAVVPDVPQAPVG